MSTCTATVFVVPREHGKFDSALIDSSAAVAGVGGVKTTPPKRRKKHKGLARTPVEPFLVAGVERT